MELSESSSAAAPTLSSRWRPRPSPAPPPRRREAINLARRAVELGLVPCSDCGDPVRDVRAYDAEPVCSQCRDQLGGGVARIVCEEADPDPDQLSRLAARAGFVPPAVVDRLFQEPEPGSESGLERFGALYAFTCVIAFGLAFYVWASL